jgi:hypothetical protein
MLNIIKTTSFPFIIFIVIIRKIKNPNTEALGLALIEGLG